MKHEEQREFVVVRHSFSLGHTSLSLAASRISSALSCQATASPISRERERGREREGERERERERGRGREGERERDAIKRLIQQMLQTSLWPTDDMMPLQESTRKIKSEHVSLTHKPFLSMFLRVNENVLSLMEPASNTASKNFQTTINH